MASLVAGGLGGPVDVTHRLARRLVESDVELDRASLLRRGNALLSDEAPLADADSVVRAVDHVLGLGDLEDLLRDADVSDLLVNGDGRVWVERGGTLSETALRMSGPAVRAAVDRVIGPLGLRLDRASPSVDARLPDGSRLHASIPPVSVDGPILAVRRFTAAVRDLDALVAGDGIRARGAELLRDAVRARSNILVAGATGSGKTTLLNILLREVARDERVVTVEDAVELQPADNIVRLEARAPNSEGVGEIDLSTLVRHALRLRPDRIVVGEVRGPEALEMILAMSTGHDGSMSTVHAGSASEALWRVETLAVSGLRTLAVQSVRAQLLATIDLVVVMRRGPSGRRVDRVSKVDDGEVEEVYRCG